MEIRELLITAAQMGQEFSQANAWTVKYDCIEDMINAEFGKCGHCDNVQTANAVCNVCGHPLYF